MKLLKKATMIKVLASLAVVFSLIIAQTSIAHATDFISVATFEDIDFTINDGAVETKTLTMDIDTISMSACCDDDPTETIYLNIEGITNPQYNLCIPFTADEEVYTFPYALPAGRYYVSFTGSSTNLKSYGIATFTKYVE